MNTDPNASWSSTELRIAVTCFVVFTLLIAVFLLGDASAFVNSADDQLIGHVGASGGFTLAAAGTLLVIRRKRPGLLSMLVAGAGLTAAFELGQWLAPTRGIELRDAITGFGGVLVAVIAIELLLRTMPLLWAARVNAGLALAGSAVLVGLLVFDLTPEPTLSAAPNGTACPLTNLDGSGQRIDLGSFSADDAGCLVTAAGGLGLFRPDGGTELHDDTVLLSSSLDVLVEAIVDNQRLVIRSQILSGDFAAGPAAPGAVVILRSDTSGDLLQLRTRGQTIQAIGPSLSDALRSLSYTQGLQPNTRYVLQVELTAKELKLSIDDELVASNRVDPQWLDVLADSATDEDVTLYIGNSPQLAHPFNGVIEWIEIGT